MSVRGTYALLLYLSAPRTLTVGALGTLGFPPGWYLYLGSDHGPGGLEARLGRHRRQIGKRFHWHIDYFRAVGRLVEIWSSSGTKRQECDWAAAAAALPGAAIIVPRFGASDCRCPSHLFYFSRRPELTVFESLAQTEVARELIDNKLGAGCI
jgi:Uri superfamily endonuclease